MPIFPAGYGTQVTAPSALDSNDAFLMSVDNVIKNVAPSAARGYFDASHYADLAATVLNTAEATTGWASTDSWNGAQPILDTTNKSTGTASVRSHVWTTSGGTTFYVDLGSDTSLSTYSHVAFDLWWDTQSGGVAPPTQYIDAVVATAVTLGGTNNTIAAPRVAAQTLTPWETFFSIYIPLTSLTAIRSIGIRAVSGGSTLRAFMNIDNVRFAAATGLDQAIHAAGTNGMVFVPPSYTTALTQRPLVSKPTGVTVLDQRTP